MRADARVAAIDVGTNAVLMLVASASASARASASAGAGGRTLVRIADHARITRLGQGVDARRALAPDAMARTLAVLREYRAIADGSGASIVAVGTSALRDAANADAFLDRARETLGVAIEVISGLREAELAYAGGLEGLASLDGPPLGDEHDEPIVLVDIGGGSTEIVVGSRRQIVARASVDVGSVRLFERHADGDPPSPGAIAAMRADIDRALDACGVSLPPNARLVAIAGTATTVAAIALDLDDVDPARARGATISVEAARSVAERLATMSTAARRAISGVDPGRADVILCGAALLARVAERAGVKQLTISDGGVRVGLALEALGLGARA